MSDNDLFKKNRGAQSAQKRSNSEQESDNQQLTASATEAESVSSGHAQQMADITSGASMAKGLSQAFGESQGSSLNESRGHNSAHTAGVTEGMVKSASHGGNQSFGETGHSEGHSLADGASKSTGESHGHGQRLASSSISQGHSAHGANASKGHQESLSHSEGGSMGAKVGHGVGGNNHNTSFGHQMGHTGDSHNQGLSASMAESAGHGHTASHGAQMGHSAEQQTGISESSGISESASTSHSAGPGNVATHCETTVTGPHSTESLCVSADLDAVRQDLKNTLEEAGFHGAADQMTPELTAEMVFKSIEAQSNEPLYVDLDNQTVTSHDPGGDNVFVVHPDDVLQSAGMAVEYAGADSHTHEGNAAQNEQGMESVSEGVGHAMQTGAGQEEPSAQAEAQAEMDMGGGM